MPVVRFVRFRSVAPVEVPLSYYCRPALQMQGRRSRWVLYQEEMTLNGPTDRRRMKLTRRELTAGHRPTGL
jgi:hypothetical protein